MGTKDKECAFSSTEVYRTEKLYKSYSSRTEVLEDIADVSFERSLQP